MKVEKMKTGKQLKKLEKKFRSSILVEYFPMFFVILVLLLTASFVIDKVPPSSSKTVSDQNPKITFFVPDSIKDKKLIALKKSLPLFEDYPAKVYSIPPKPLLVHESNPYGMKYWTLTENWIDEATEYDIAGHYLMGGYGTGKSGRIIIDGLTGQVFHEYGSRYYTDSVVSSSLVIFDPIDIECFSSDGDYEPCYARGVPQYVIWEVEQFVTICEPVIKNWKVVSCGDSVTAIEIKETSENTDVSKIMDAIKYLESENLPILGEAPTEEEIFNSPHIKQIRLALSGYLDGTNSGLEDEALDATSVDMKCGLNNFDKTYYQSKFVILDTYDNDYGGIQAYITFIDKPDTVFWVWIYGMVGEQRLRTFCEKPPLEGDEQIFKTFIEDKIKSTKPEQIY